MKKNRANDLKVLFLGNSYTAGIKDTFEQLAVANSRRNSTFMFIWDGGVTLQKLIDKGKASKWIKKEEWDYVVLQEQSLRPALSGRSEMAFRKSVLDAHPRLGNNAQICQALGLGDLKPFGFLHGVALGFRGTLPEVLDYAQFKERTHEVFGNTVGTMDFGKSHVRTVAVVSGGAAGLVEEAGESGVDVYISGEPKLTAWHLAQELGVNAIFAGHYATEVFGVKAVAEALSAEFNVQADFIDMGIAY